MNIWIIFAIIWIIVYGVCFLFIDEKKDKTTIDNSILPTIDDCFDFFKTLRL